MFGIRLFFIGLIATAIAGGGFYVFKLQKDNAILTANAIKMESAISEQKELIENQKKDFEAILNANKEMNELIGKLAIEKTKAIERIMNKGGDNAARCIEIASGSPLTEKEINATKKSEINPECPSIANPNYVPY